MSNRIASSCHFFEHFSHYIVREKSYTHIYNITISLEVFNIIQIVLLIYRQLVIIYHVAIRDVIFEFHFVLKESWRP